MHWPPSPTPKGTREARGGNSDLQCQIFSTSVNSQGQWNKAEHSYVEKRAAKKVKSIPPKEERGLFHKDGEKMKLPWLSPFSTLRREVSMPTLSSCYSWTILFHSPLFLNSAAARGLLQPRRGKGYFCLGSAQDVVLISEYIFILSFVFPKHAKFIFSPICYRRHLGKGLSHQ